MISRKTDPILWWFYSILKRGELPDEDHWYLYYTNKSYKTAFDALMALAED